MSVQKYTVGTARSEHIDLLPEIEIAAAARFPDAVITADMRTSVVPRHQLEIALKEQRLWTAVTETGKPVGFAIAQREAKEAFLKEIDVHPDHQRRRLGRRLIQEVIEWARVQALPCVTLTTFENVAWNAPFYSKLGFQKLTTHELSSSLRNRLETERMQGLRQRVAMRLML